MSIDPSPRALGATVVVISSEGRVRSASASCTSRCGDGAPPPPPAPASPLNRKSSATCDGLSSAGARSQTWTVFDAPGAIVSHSWSGRRRPVTPIGSTHVAPPLPTATIGTLQIALKLAIDAKSLQFVSVTVARQTYEEYESKEEENKKEY